MAEQLNIRVTKDMPDIATIEKAAAELGMNRNQLAIEGVKMMCFWDKVFYSKMKAYADGVGLSMAQVMQNFLIKRLAEDAAEDTVYGAAPRALVELPMTNRGLVTGKELFDNLYNLRVEELYRERARRIRQDVENGLPASALSAEDKEVLKKYGG
jgi:hypothetical protein